MSFSIGLNFIDPRLAAPLAGRCAIGWTVFKGNKTPRKRGR